MVDFQYKDYYDVDDFRKLIAVLRSENGCPWDREQTHESIRRNLLEEAYEVCETIDDGDTAHLREELGDVLMQVIIHARMEEEIGSFNLDDVADEACKKLILRHPHVFGETTVENSTEVLQNWDEIKRKTRAQASVSSVMEGVSKGLPALWRAEKIQYKAKKAGFDWTSLSDAMPKLREEVDELASAIANNDTENIFEELGDVLFSAVNLSRLAGVDPETALNACSDKFIRRFRAMEELAKEKGEELSSLPLDEQEALYQQGKNNL